MAAHTYTDMSNGHTFTVVEARSALDGKPVYTVQERDHVGAFVGTVYTSRHLAMADGYARRAS